MKSLLPAVLLSLLFLSITYSEVSAKELECYKLYLGEKLEKKVTCPGDDVVCVTGIDTDDSNVVFKNCGTREEVESECQKLSNLECKTCDSDLCNNKGSTKELECYKLYLGEKSEKKVTCPGDDVVCVTGIDTDDSHVVFKNCATREEVESECQKLSNLECKTCDSDRCNNE